MVLCQYYLAGNCRYGSKCINEHFDVRQLIKTEVEAAIKGTQWPLSCFGPFKEKPCLQNFITDQSFEEVRHLCYEAKNQNNFPTFAQQFSQQVLDAQNRMKALLSLNRDVVNMVINLYNSPDPNAAASTAANPSSQVVKSNNPFSLAGGGFGSNQNNNSNNTNSIFGSSTAQTNPFANSAFGGAAQQSTTSIFGGGGGGGQPAATNSGGIFGQTAFGSNNPTFGTPKPSVFGTVGQQQTNTFQLAQIGSINQQSNQTAGPGFGLTATSTNAFGGQPANSFGNPGGATQPSIFSQQQGNQMQPSGIFAQQSQQMQQQQQPQNLAFGQTVQQQSSVFGAVQQPGIFGQPNQPNNSLFATTLGSPQPQQQQSQQAGFSGQQPQIQTQQQSQMGFGMQQPNNVFVAPHQQQQQHPANTMMQGGNFFAGGGQPPAPTGNAFHQNVQQSFGVVDDIPDSAYSRMEDLTPDALEAFKAPEFVLGKLPTMPPPKELCQ